MQLETEVKELKADAQKKRDQEDKEWEQQRFLEADLDISME